jgi:hypothetical protein
MEDLSEELASIVGQPENETLEYKAVLPPSRVIAQLICSFANTSGGYIILGVYAKPSGLEIKGLSEDFQATMITHKAVDLLYPTPQVRSQYFYHFGKKLFAIKVGKQSESIFLEKKKYVRKGTKSFVLNAEEIEFNRGGFEKIKVFNQSLSDLNLISTGSKNKFIEHYRSVLKIMDDLASTLYPSSPDLSSTIPEGKVLSRILFSSCVDNFETYLSDILFEIYLAKPQTLKSKQEVTIEEVLNCADLQDFVRYYAKQKLLKLQKGSVKGFVKENKQISDLKVINEQEQNKVEGILQIRHLYSHRNGVVDEKFLHYFPIYKFHQEHAMSISEICDKLMYLADLVDALDKEAIKKYNLATI